MIQPYGQPTTFPSAASVPPRRRLARAAWTSLAFSLLLAPLGAWAQDALPAALARPVAASLLPQDLSPWGMVAGADWVVQAVIAGLAFASVLTWTVALAKGVELLLAGRHARAGLAALLSAGSLDEAGRRLGPVRGPCAALVEAARQEVAASADALGKEGVKERAAWRLERLVAGAGRGGAPACWPPSAPRHPLWGCSARCGAS